MLKVYTNPMLKDKFTPEQLLPDVQTAELKQSRLREFFTVNNLFVK